MTDDLQNLKWTTLPNDLFPVVIWLLEKLGGEVSIPEDYLQDKNNWENKVLAASNNLDLDGTIEVKVWVLPEEIRRALDE